MLTLGIDVSHWEGVRDWGLTYPTIGFAYYKCTDGLTWVDVQFANNKAGCDKYGIPHAPYHWFQPDYDAIKQAQHFVNTAGTGYKRYIVDAEEPGVSVPRTLKIFLDEVTRLTGVRPAIYTGAGYWNEYVGYQSWAKDYPLIVANYTYKHQPTLPIGWTNYVIWQFTDYFFAPGNNEAVDGDWFNGDMTQCRNWFGNYHEYEPLPPNPHALLYICKTEGLRIRTAPNTSAPIVGQLHANEQVEALQIGGYNCWLKHSRGWSAVEYAGYKYMIKVEP